MKIKIFSILLIVALLLEEGWTGNILGPRRRRRCCPNQSTSIFSFANLRNLVISELLLMGARQLGFGGLQDILGTVRSVIGDYMNEDPYQMGGGHYPSGGGHYPMSEVRTYSQHASMSPQMRRSLEQVVTRNMFDEYVETTPQFTSQDDFKKFVRKHIEGGLEEIRNNPRAAALDDDDDDDEASNVPDSDNDDNILVIPQLLFNGIPIELEHYVSNSIDRVGWNYDGSSSKTACEGNFKVRMTQEINVLKEILRLGSEDAVNYKCDALEIAGGISYNYVPKSSSKSVGLVACKCQLMNAYSNSVIHNDSFHFTEMAPLNKHDPCEYIHLQQDSKDRDSYVITSGWSLE